MPKVRKASPLIVSNETQNFFSSKKTSGSTHVGRRRAKCVFGGVNKYVDKACLDFFQICSSGFLIEDA